jgi:hypothetical protein
VSRGKPRPEIVLAVRRDGDIHTFVAAAKPSSFNTEEGRALLMTKLREDRRLTIEERSFLVDVLEDQRTRAKSLRVARCFLVLRALNPKPVKTEVIRDACAAMFQCSPAAIRNDLRVAKKFDDGKWWKAAQRDLVLPTW